jgi:hypothetical protein
MAAIWASFQSGFTSFLASKNAGSEQATAKKIAQLYHSAVQTAMPTMVPGAMPIGLSPSVLESGFAASFKMAKAAGKVKATPATYMPAAGALVAYWTGKTFNPAVPPPGFIPGVSNVVLVPGVPPAPQIMSAFSANVPSAVSSGLVAAFSSHMMSISGLFTGNPIGSPSPAPFPWVGIA